MSLKWRLREVTVLGGRLKVAVAKGKKEEKWGHQGKIRQILRFFHFTFKTSIVDSFKRTSPIYPLYQPSCKSTLFNQNKMPTVSKKPSIIFFTVLWEIYQRDTFLRFSVFYIKKQCLRECLYLVQNNVSSQVCTFNSFLIIQ